MPWVLLSPPASDLSRAKQSTLPLHGVKSALLALGSLGSHVTIDP